MYVSTYVLYVSILHAMYVYFFFQTSKKVICVLTIVKNSGLLYLVLVFSRAKKGYIVAIAENFSHILLKKKNNDSNMVRLTTHSTIQHKQICN
jgi:hypothetical protein